MSGSREMAGGGQRRRDVKRQRRAETARLTVVGGQALGLPAELRERIDGHLAVFAEAMREGVLAACAAVGLEVLAELFEEEATAKAGPKGRHDASRTAKRHGPDDGTVTLGGRRLPVQRPRLRSADGAREVPLETYLAAASSDLLDETVVARMLAGISTRRYPVALEPLGAAVDDAAVGTSKSSVSRRFVAATGRRLAELQARRLDGRRWLVVYVDGFGFGEHLLLGALGVDSDGNKMALGVVEGTAENFETCRDLIGGLADRGLDASEGILFVVDGSPGIAKAVRHVYRSKALIARCRRHKLENVRRRLPDRDWPWVKAKMAAAWANPDPDEGQRQLEALANQLQKARPGAAGSLREGLAETFTVSRLGIGGTLGRTLATTNPMESTVEIVRDHACRVKHWQGGEMALRWAAAGMLTAERQYRRVKGHKALPHLQAALAAAVGVAVEGAASA